MSTPLGQLGIGNEHHDSFNASMQMDHHQNQQHMPNMNPPTDASMMNQVLDRVQNMEDDPHISNINGEMMAHNMDPSQIPPEQQYEYAPEEQHHGMWEQSSMEQEPESWAQKLQTGVKGPFLVFLIAFIINLPQITRMLTHFVPKLLKESGQLNLYGVAVKALIIAVLYGLVSFATN
jgi:hypothetical protein